jgi:hypothetical protein
MRGQHLGRPLGSDQLGAGDVEGGCGLEAHPCGGGRTHAHQAG